MLPHPFDNRFPKRPVTMSGGDVDMASVLQRGVADTPGIGHGDGLIMRHPRVVVAGDQETRLQQAFPENTIR